MNVYGQKQLQCAVQLICGSQGLAGAADDLSNLRSAEPDQYRHQFLDNYDQVRKLN